MGAINLNRALKRAYRRHVVRARAVDARPLSLRRFVYLSLSRRENAVGAYAAAWLSRKAPRGLTPLRRIG